MELTRNSTWKRMWAVLKGVATVVAYGLMLLAVLALWNNDAPQFIYVAF